MKAPAFVPIIGLVFSCLVPGSVFGQKTVDLLAALDLARKNNPDWRAAEQDVEITRGKLTTAHLLSPFNPVIESQSGRRTIPGAGKGTDYSVGVSMELEVAGQRGVRITEAERDLQRAEASSKDFSRTFAGKLARAFYQAMFVKERLDLLRKVEALNRQLSEVTKIEFDAGDVSGLEVSVAQVRYGRSRKETFDAERNLTQALLDLKRLIGVEEMFLPNGSLGVVAAPFPPPEALERALRNRPDLYQGMEVGEVVRKGCLLRLRPVLMTATVAVLGLLPLLVSTGVGAEVHRPLAAVVVGGLISSSALTLLILPLIFVAIESRPAAAPGSAKHDLEERRRN